MGEGAENFNIKVHDFYEAIETVMKIRDKLENNDAKKTENKDSDNMKWL